MKRSFAVAALAVVFAVPAYAQVRITEWMYNGASGEFIEFSNMGSSPVDFTGWSFDDDSRMPGTVSLSAFGVVAPGQSVILAEPDAASFRMSWGLASSVQVIGGNATNLGRADELNLYDATSALVDRLTYGDTVIPGTIRTLDVSGRPGSLAALGVNDVSLWVLSSVGDGAGSYAALEGNVGNPGIAPIPEPGTYAMLLAGLGMLALIARRRITS